MKKILYTLLLSSFFFSCHAKITQASDMEEYFQLFKDADSKTLAIFDVDMVLVQPSDPAYQMATMKKYSAIAKRIFKDVPFCKHNLFLSLMTISSDPVLIDARTPQLIQQLIQKGIPVMAMTANLTGEFESIKSMEEWRIKHLRALGIDFSKSAPFQEKLIFKQLDPYRGQYTTYQDGILFVNGTAVSKGDAFLAFLNKTNLSFNKIIFIDDREDNLKSMEAALESLEKPVEFTGVHFIGAQKYPSKEISEAEFESKWQNLAEQAKKFEVPMNETVKVLGTRKK